MGTIFWVFFLFLAGFYFLFFMFRCLLKWHFFLFLIYSGGGDRSSVFVTLSVLIQQLKAEERVDIFQAARYTRSQRHCMLQTLVRYTFISSYTDIFIICIMFWWEWKQSLLIKRILKAVKLYNMVPKLKILHLEVNKHIKIITTLLKV